MKSNEYGWLTTASWGDQVAGFFIDKDGLILYWPKANKNGYAIDRKAVAELCAVHSQKNNSLLLPITFLSALSGLIATLCHLLPTYSQVLTTASYSVFIALLGFFIIGISNRLGLPLSNSPINLARYDRIPKRRPPPNIIKPSAKLGKIKFCIFILCFLALTVFFAYASYDLYELNLKQSWLFIIPLITSFILGFIVIVELKKEVTGLKITNIHITASNKQFSTNLQKVLDQQNTLKNRFFKTWQMIKSYWGIWLVLAMIFRAPIYYDLYKTPYLSVEVITTNYAIHISEKIQFNNAAYLYKWDKDIDLYLGPYSDQKFRNDLLKDFKRRASLIGINLNEVKYLKNKKGIALTFSHNLKTHATEINRLFKPKLSHVKGQVQHFQLRISPKSFERSLGGEQLKDDTRRRGYFSFLFYSCLNFRHGLLYANGYYRDNNQDIVTIRRVIAAIQFDKRIKAGMTTKELDKILPVIAQEIEDAPSFDYWLKNIRA